jgi:hypothetical protein
MSDEVTSNENTKRGACGVVMPIPPTEGYSPEHWPEVETILKTVATESGFDPNLVSNANDVGIIQKRIIENLYFNDIVICDVSSKNPNVMFELGIRLAFDKPTIIIKDDQTDYSFDTAPIEHLTYPKDLNYSKILKFQIALKGKLLGASERFRKDPNASTFLKAFGQFQVANLETKEVSIDQFILDEIKELRSEVAAIHRSQQQPLFSPSVTFSQQRTNDPDMLALWKGMVKAREEEMANELRHMKPVGFL